MQAEPQKQHQWLKKLLGDWTMTSEASMGPDKPPVTNEGTESVRALGDLWVIGDGRWSMPSGGDMVSQITLGFDPEKGRFVGTWVGSPMTTLWLYDGELNAEETKLTLNSEGPSMGGEGLAKYQDIIEFLSDDHRTLTSQMLTADGAWQHFMTAHYHRVISA